MEKNIFKTPYSIGDILSHSWKLFTENFTTILIIILFVYIPLNVLLKGLTAAFVTSTEPLEILMVEIRWLQFLEAIIGILAILAITWLVKTKLEGKNIGWRECLGKAFQKWPAAFGTNILKAVFLIGLFILLIVPGVIFSIYWLFVIYIVVFHDKAFIEALKHSREIVKGRWWKVFGYSLVLGLISLVVALGVGAIIGIPSIFIGESVIIDIVTAVILNIFLSYFLVAGVVFFVNFDNNRVSKVEKGKKQIPAQVQSPH